MKINFEHTDTFGGESNYSWVRRHTLEIAEKTTNLAIVRKAKKWADLTNLRCRVESHGDMIAIYPIGICHVVFVTFGE